MTRTLRPLLALALGLSLAAPAMAERPPKKVQPERVSLRLTLTPEARAALASVKPAVRPAVLPRANKVWDELEDRDVVQPVLDVGPVQGGVGVRLGARW